MANGVLLHFENGLIKVSRKSVFKAEATYYIIPIEIFSAFACRHRGQLTEMLRVSGTSYEKKAKTCCPPSKRWQ